MLIPCWRPLVGVHWLGMLVAVGFGLTQGGFAAPDFGRDIRPILQRNCFSCHGPEKQKSGYRLDVREVALKGGDRGHAAIIPHRSKDSPLIRYVSGEDEEIVMPPKQANAQRLTGAEVQMLSDWIDSGPSWPEEWAGETGETKLHWSLQPLRRPEVPSIAQITPSAVHEVEADFSKPALIAASANPIDAFIGFKLVEKGLTPSPEADRRTLLRRVSYDLTGLPPTPEAVAAFVADPDPRAYEKRVGELLDSPRYGERWARHWFDTIHFADSHGYEHDLGRDHAWRFRDYVIAAFNRDTPWDRFIREQLAADYFYPEEPWLTPALGFLGAGPFDLSTFSTGPVTFDYLDRDDLVTQTMATFVSTTANCARCHAHKFDPISQEDYYALQAVFAGVLKGDVSYDQEPTVARERRRWKELLVAADRKDTAILLASENESTVNSWLEKQRHSVRWHSLELDTYLAVEGSTLTRTNRVIFSSGPRPDKDIYLLTASSPLTNVTAVRLDVLADDSLPLRGPGRNDNGNLHLSEFEMRLFESGSSRSKLVKFRRASADFNQTDWGIERALDGDLKTAWGIHPAVGQSHRAVFELSEPLTLQPGSQLTLSLKQVHGGGHLVGAFSLAVTDEDPALAVVRPPEVEAALAITSTERTEAQRVAVAAHALRQTATRALDRFPPPSVVFAAASGVHIVGGNTRELPEPKIVNVLQRGDFDQPRAVVGPGALSALTHLPARFVLANPTNECARRAALADWLAHPENPLTWRSVVNRAWHYHFGRGLCDTPGDFGKMGGTPSHPELIDWLAVWFRDEARGSLKELHRLLVTSATYRQSSEHRDSAARIDGDNRLLWRQNRTRLDADAIRDFILSASGSLDLSMGGVAVQHFSRGPGPQLTPTLDYTGFDWAQPGAGRRSIYRYVWRGIADPFMESFDFPDLGLLSPTRGFSVSALQALTLFHNDFVLHHSAVMARAIETGSPTREGQVVRAVQLVWLREPRADELVEFTAFVRDQGLPAFGRLLFNSNEFLFVE